MKVRFGLLLAFAACNLGCRSPQSSSNEEPSHRVDVTQFWSIELPTHFQHLDHGGEWQAYDAHRVVYVSSDLPMGTLDPAHDPAPTSDPMVLANQWLTDSFGDSGTSEQLEQAADGSTGRAIVRATPKFQLKGYVARGGQVAICAIDADDPKYRSWAIKTWKSLGHR